MKKGTKNHVTLTYDLEI